MDNKVDFRRRLLGGIFLGAALLMLIAGETVLRDSLHAMGFIVYWLVCVAFTGLAILVAFLDLSAVRHRARGEQRALVEETLQEISRSENAKAGKLDTGNRP